MKNACALEDTLGYVFKDKSLLETALTHPSYAAENGCESYQRLEYLGDAVLGFIAARELFRSYPDADEGELTDLRKSAVSCEPLTEASDALQLYSYVRIARNTKGKKIKSDLFEAVIAALYLDGGLEECERITLELLGKRLKNVRAAESVRDYKSELNEAYGGRFAYVTVSESGPPHAPIFEVVLYVDGKIEERASASGKKIAERDCAKKFLSRN